MDKLTFWRLIEEAKQQSHGDVRKQAKSLFHLLSALPPDEIKAFDALFEEYYDKAYMSARLYHALVRLFVYVSHEELMGFVMWLMIGQGEALYSGVLRHPYHIGDILVVGKELAECDGERVQSAIGEAYWRVTGRGLESEKLEASDAAREEERRKRTWRATVICGDGCRAGYALRYALPLWWDKPRDASLRCVAQFCNAMPRAYRLRGCDPSILVTMTAWS